MPRSWSGIDGLGGSPPTNLVADLGQVAATAGSHTKPSLCSGNLGKTQTRGRSCNKTSAAKVSRLCQVSDTSAACGRRSKMSDVLLVEDEPDVAELVQEALAEAALSVTVALNDRSAYAQLEREARSFAAVVTDINLGEASQASTSLATRAS